MMKHSWKFPLPRTHTGLPLGNGRMGVLIWGEDNRLKMTIGRADFWDRRCGKSWKAGMNFKQIRAFLEAGDEAGIRQLFSSEPAKPGLPWKSSVLPIGRVDLVFGEGYFLTEAELDFSTAIATIYLQNSEGIKATVTLELSLETPLLQVKYSEGIPVPEIVRVPSWEYVGKRLKDISFSEPEPFDGEVSGWVQRTPNDGAVTVGWKQDAASCSLRVFAVLEEKIEDVLQASMKGNREWWAKYWSRVPKITVPDANYQFLYAYGMYKFAGLTHPAGVAATLQGPWVEEYQMPPWSCDYHFNINVQMCYSPALQAGLYEHLMPLFKMIEGWLPTMRENARLFVGIEDGYLLPHAVNDKCGIIGSFWSGTIDHACTAWVGQMMFDYWRYSGDEEFLRKTAYPFMKGGMRVFEEMMERLEDGSLSLPVSVSPEYRGDAMNAWGRDASCQLAACHQLAEALLRAAEVLGEKPCAFWNEVREKLPKATIEKEPTKGREVVALWKGLPLEESHRHHAHLSGISPFDVFDWDDPKWKEILKNTITQWHRLGMGLWAGWSMPWAVMLHHRAGNPEVAHALVHYWESIYTNEGHGTLHDPMFYNTSLGGGVMSLAGGGATGEIMQMEAGMCMAAAIMDAFLLVRRGVHVLFQGAPGFWRECGFEDMRGEGGFRFSAYRGVEGVEWVRIVAERAGTVRVANPWKDDVRGAVIVLEMKAGDVVKLTA